MTPPDTPFATVPAAVPAPLRAGRGARPGPRGRRRRLRPWMLGASVLLHLALLVALLFAHRRLREAAVAPSFQVLFQPPGTEIGKQQAAKPSELPGPPLPPAPATVPPSAASPPPPAAMPPLAAPPSAALPSQPHPPTAAAPTVAPPPPLPSAEPMPLSPAAPAPSTALTPAVPVPQPPAPPKPAPAELPSVRLSPELSEFAPPPPPVPLPQPAPLPPAPRHQRAFPRPMDTSLGTSFAPSHARPGQRGTGAIDLALGRAARDSMGAPPRDTDAQSGDIVVRGAHVGKDWEELLHEWWLRHAFYPDEAARRGEDGTVRIHVKVDRYGHVHLVELESSSGSQWLDMGAQATFRDATLPPFPPSTPEPDADLDITIRYILVGR